jgi:3-methyl-2-oxobutanoate hydroxymethyltransferase
MSKRKSIYDLYSAKQQGHKIVAVSCYDYTTARLVAQTDIEMIIVGDSAAQLLLGYDSTLPATMDFMVMMTAAVRRGAPDVCLVADMPFMSYQACMADALKNAARFVREAGAQIVKIEASSAYLDIVRAISDAGIAVMAHIGIKPQQISKMGRLRVEGTDAEMAQELIQLAEKMVQAGASTLLIEGTAAEVAKHITEQCVLPVISCGAGPDCDGQVLVAHDILGLTQEKKPKFSMSFSELGQAAVDAFGRYYQVVSTDQFPDHDHSYHMKAGELDKLKKLLSR